MKYTLLQLIYAPIREPWQLSQLEPLIEQYTQAGWVIHSVCTTPVDQDGVHVLITLQHE